MNECLVPLVFFLPNLLRQITPLDIQEYYAPFSVLAPFLTHTQSQSFSSLHYLPTRRQPYIHGEPFLSFVQPHSLICWLDFYFLYFFFLFLSTSFQPLSLKPLPHRSACLAYRRVYLSVCLSVCLEVPDMKPRHLPPAPGAAMDRSYLHFGFGM